MAEQLMSGTNPSSDVKSTTVNSSSPSKTRPVPVVAVAPKIKKFEPTLKSSEKLTQAVDLD